MKRISLVAAAALGAVLFLAPFAHPTSYTAAANAAQRLEAWTPGTLDLHQISTGRGNAALVVFPDGTTLLFDCGDAGNAVPLATPLPDGSRPAGEWVARYVKRALGEDAVLDYVVVSHLHIDHMGGLGKLVESVPVKRLLDRGFPDYGEPAAPSGAIFEAYRRDADAAAKKGAIRARVTAGRADQLVPVRGGPIAGFSVRAVSANGEVWTGTGDAVEKHFPKDAGLPEADRAPENPSSVSLLLRYGPFSLFTGGDLYGMPEPGAPSWWDVETPIAKAIGRTDILVVDHHGSIEPANPFFLATLAPRVVIVPAWSPTHPSPDVVKRLLSKRIWPAPRDVFVTHLRDATKATIGPRADQFASTAGHVVVRVAPGGASYRVFVVDDGSESGVVTSVHGPYVAAAAKAP